MTNFWDTLYFKMEMLLFLFQILFLAEIFSIDQIMKWLICSIDSLRNANVAITKYEECLVINVMVLQLTC